MVGRQLLRTTSVFMQSQNAKSCIEVLYTCPEFRGIQILSFELVVPWDLALAIALVSAVGLCGYGML